MQRRPRGILPLRRHCEDLRHVRAAQIAEAPSAGREPSRSTPQPILILPHRGGRVAVCEQVLRKPAVNYAKIRRECACARSSTESIFSNHRAVRGHASNSSPHFQRIRCRESLNLLLEWRSEHRASAATNGSGAAHGTRRTAGGRAGARGRPAQSPRSTSLSITVLCA